MKKMPRDGFGVRHQKGVVLLVSLLFLLLLTLLGVSSMQNATLQEKMAGSVTTRNVTFQGAESALRQGESTIRPGFVLAVCANAACAPPNDSTTVTEAGNGTSGRPWVAAVGGGLYTVQNIGTTADPVERPLGCNISGTYTLYRVTAVFFQGVSRTVLESIYANC
jgi:type IV pilus assembly protein PilX